jgi:hypothetical protein
MAPIIKLLTSPTLVKLSISLLNLVSFLALLVINNYPLLNTCPVIPNEDGNFMIVYCLYSSPASNSSYNLSLFSDIVNSSYDLRSLNKIPTESKPMNLGTAALILLIKSLYDLCVQIELANVIVFITSYSLIYISFSAINLSSFI